MLQFEGRQTALYTLIFHLRTRCGIAQWLTLFLNILLMCYRSCQLDCRLQGRMPRSAVSFCGISRWWPIIGCSTEKKSAWIRHRVKDCQRAPGSPAEGWPLLLTYRLYCKVGFQGETQIRQVSWRHFKGAQMGYGGRHYAGLKIGCAERAELKLKGAFKRCWPCHQTSRWNISPDEFCLWCFQTF